MGGGVDSPFHLAVTPFGRKGLLGWRQRRSGRHVAYLVSARYLTVSDLPLSPLITTSPGEGVMGAAIST